MSRPEEPSGRGQLPRQNSRRTRIGDTLVAPAELREMIELRLLMEIPAVRKVAERGVTDSELAALERLAAATMAPARDGDIPGYINADLTFHLYLLELAGNQQLVEVVRVLRSRSRLHGLRDSDFARFMRQNAREHLDLVDLLAEGRASAVDDLLRGHLSAIKLYLPEKQ